MGTWIGIFDENSADRISNKLLHLMGKCLREPEFCEEQLRSNDSVAISCALWAKGFYDAGAGVEAVLELIKNGTKNQKLTAPILTAPCRIRDSAPGRPERYFLHIRRTWS